MQQSGERFVPPRMENSHLREQPRMNPNWSVNAQSPSPPFPPPGFEPYPGAPQQVLYHVVPGSYYQSQQQVYPECYPTSPPMILPPNKEMPGRLAITICATCNSNNFMCQIELNKIDTYNRQLEEEKKELLKENESLKLRIAQLESGNKQLPRGRKNGHQNSDINLNVLPNKILSPEARVFSPKKQEEVPVVSVKEITVAEQNNATTQVGPELPSVINHPPALTVEGTGNTWKVTNSNSEPQELKIKEKQPTYQEPVMEENWDNDPASTEKCTDDSTGRDMPTGSVQDTDWHEDKNYVNQISSQVDREKNQEHTNYKNKSHSSNKRRGSDHENKIGQDGWEKTIKKNDNHQRNSFTSEQNTVQQKRKYKSESGRQNDQRFAKTNERPTVREEARRQGEESSKTEGERRKFERNAYVDKQEFNKYDKKGMDRQRQKNNDQPRQSQRVEHDNAYQYQSRGKFDNRADDFKGSRSEMKPVKDIVKEIDGDLFSAPPEFSLGHCVAKDFRMGSGIAVKFKQEFKGTGDLLDQDVPVGGCAYLKDRKCDRYIFYLVTKAISSGKPTMNTLEMSLEALRKKCQELSVTKLAIPRIGCGLDRLEWGSVKNKINMVFQDTDMEIVVYNFNADGAPEAEGKRPAGFGPRVEYHIMKLQTIDVMTGLLFFGTEDGYVDTTAASLDEKFHFIQWYKNANKTAGKVWCWDKNTEYYIYGLIVSKSFVKNKFSFNTLEECCKELSKLLKEHQFHFVGLECLTEWNDDDTFTEKVVTMLRHSLPRPVSELWVCYRDEKDDPHKMCANFELKAKAKSQY